MTRVIDQFPLPTDSQLRKEMPICEGVLDYFPLSAAYVARISYLGNEKHNPGEKLHWARGKSMDQHDCIARHLVERGTFDLDDGALHDGKLAWRAWAALELELERRISAGEPIWREDIIAENRKKSAEKLAAKIAAKQNELIEAAIVGGQPALDEALRPFVTNTARPSDPPGARFRDIRDPGHQPVPKTTPLPPRDISKAELLDPYTDLMVAKPDIEAGR